MFSVYNMDKGLAENDDSWIDEHYQIPPVHQPKNKKKMRIKTCSLLPEWNERLLNVSQDVYNYELWVNGFATSL